MKRILHLLALLFAVLLIASCSDGGGGAGADGTEEETPAETTDQSKEQAAALVGEGKAGLEALLSQPLSPIPFSAVSDVAALFAEAAALDPTNPEAAFFGGVGKVIAFLDSETTAAFLAAMGWPKLDDACATEKAFEVISVAIGGVPLDNSTPDIPDDTLMVFTTPCDEIVPYNEGDFGILAGPGEDLEDGRVLVGGIAGAADLTIGQLLQFFTGDFANALGEAVALLEQVPADFRTTLSFVPYQEPAPLRAGELLTFELDYADAKLAQTVLATLRAGLVAPTIWTYPGLDAFIDDNRLNPPDPEPPLPPTPPIVDITNEEFAAYFNSGLGGAGIPFAANQTGKANLKSSLSSALLGAQQFLTGFTGETDDQSDDALPQNLLFDLLAAAPGEYDNKNAVVTYFLEPVQATAEELRLSITQNSASIHVYQAAAFIQDWGACVPVLGGAPEPEGEAIGNDATAIAPTDFIATPLTVLGTDLSAPSVDPIFGTGLDTTTIYSFTIGSIQNVSIYATGTGDTDAALFYDSGSGLVAWDRDIDSGERANFGMSIDADYFVSSLPDAAKAPVTFYLEVRAPFGDDYKLYVVANDDANWPAGAPIFLKGGGGRNFAANVFELGSVNASLGGVLDVLTTLWDNSNRDLTFIPDDPQTPADESTQTLFYAKSVVRNEISRVFPSPPITDWGDLALPDPPVMDLFSPVLNFTPPDMVIEADPLPDVSALFGGAMPFCAYPKDLGLSLGLAGGYSPIGDGLTAAIGL